ncbi:hypothetical protein KGQ20_00340 [Catenulispora sp. NF23]|uniref:DUF4253 domain-containing protein n=1 Tax=Catenulispora pinistramenti TaxID=2705254 RepID=A0ABS5KKV7_9ACTN|nr:hypothetical protein [Catenulispora pinistramenti]MBS2531213.1 hypothetical protein [Catenulispora pinistramenti]MBS2546670.1 hypothetical protein [Catenulispora pinistramenti]
MEIAQLPAQGYRGADTFSVALIDGAESFDVLMRAFGRVEAEHRGQGRCFLTLDDLDQCLYTSEHSRSMYGLDEGVAYPAEDTPEVLTAYEVARFQAGAAALRDPVRTVPWDSVCGSLVLEPSDVDALVTLNRNPGVVVGDRHVVQCLPTDDGTDLLAGIPNGYFFGDWTPFDCHSVARRLSERHGYVLFGIGAATLGFRSVSGAGERDWDALIADLQELYGEQGSSAWAGLVPTLHESRMLLLGYADQFAELVVEG